jgi:hypothetical protein
LVFATRVYRASLLEVDVSAAYLINGNPFYRGTGEALKVDEVIARFCPTHVLSMVEQPRNQIIFGGPGAGKSILLRSLAYSTSKRVFADASNHRPFGVYINCRAELECLNNVHDTAQSGGVVERIPDVGSRCQSFVQHFISITVAWAVSKELIEISPSSEGDSALLDDIVTEVGRLCRTDDARTLPEIAGALRARRTRMRTHMAHQTMFTDAVLQECSIQETGSFIDNLLRLTSDYLEHLGLDEPRVFLLLDHFECFREPLQQTMNVLMRRGNPFVVKAAVRPFSLWTTRCLGDLRLSPNEDFYPVYVEYSPEKFGQYLDLLDTIILKLMGNAEGARSLLGRTVGKENPIISSEFAEFPVLAKLSSGLVGNFIELLGLAVHFTNQDGHDWRQNGLRLEDLGGAATKLSRDELDRVASIEGVSGEPVRTLVEDLCALLKPIGKADVFEINGSMLPGMQLSGESSRILRLGFQHGALKFIADSDASLFELPDQFAVNPVFFPRFSISV